MSKMSNHYGVKQITKHLNYAFVRVHQQNAETESKVFDNAGRNVVEKLKPSLANIANNKEVARDCHVIIALFGPDRYGVTEYNDYDIARLRDNYRSLLLLKNRMGPVNKEVPLYFNGAINHFTELPIQMTGELYDKIEKVRLEANKDYE